MYKILIFKIIPSALLATLLLVVLPSVSFPQTTTTISYNDIIPPVITIRTGICSVGIFITDNQAVDLKASTIIVKNDKGDDITATLNRVDRGDGTTEAESVFYGFFSSGNYIIEICACDKAGNRTCIIETLEVTSCEEHLCDSIAPSFGFVGNTLDVVISGWGTNFGPTSTVNFDCAGVTVNSVTANSATELTANITIAPDAPTGYCDVTVNTGTVWISCDESFKIACKCCTACNGVAPCTASAGETMDVMLRLCDVDVSGVENLGVTFSCTGVTVNSVTAISADEVNANITVACDAPQCTGDVTITGGPSGSEGNICADAFTVNASQSCTLTAEPASLRAGFLFPRLHLIRIKSPNANFTSESTVEIEGMRIIKVFETTTDQISALVLIPPKLHITKGMKQIKATTETGGLCPEICTGEIEIK